MLENKTVSHLQLIRAAKDAQSKKQPQGKGELEGWTIRPFAKTSETLKVVPNRQKGCQESYQDSRRGLISKQL